MDDKNFIKRISARVWEDNILEKLRVSYNVEKSEDNLEDNSGYTDDKLEYGLAIKSAYTEVGSEYIKDKSENKLKYKSEDKLEEKTEGMSGYKSEDKQEAKSNKYRYLKFSLLNLKGLQFKIFDHISSICLVNDDLSTGPQKTTKIALENGCSYDSTKKTIARLIQKGILNRLKGKSSCGGFINLYITQEIKDAILENKLGYTSGDKLRYKQGDRSEDKLNSSSGYIYKTTTTDDKQNLNLSQPQFSTEWQNIDIEPLNKIGFTVTHLSQIASQNKLPPQVAQDSIYAFAFDLQENNKVKSIKGDPINFFMGILRNGKPYTPASNYESPQDKAMRLYSERMREIEQRRVGVEKEAINLAYNDWFEQLTDTQKKEFLPISLRQNARLEKNKMLEGSSRNYFETEIWPSKKREIEKISVGQGRDEENNSN